jgi:hypothetical protein
MWCLRARRLISAFHDRELDPETAQEVAAHLEHCERCGRELQRVKQGAEIASVFRPEEPESVPLQPVNLPPRDPERRSSRQSAGLCCVAAVLAAVLAAGVLLHSPLHNALWRSVSGNCCTLNLGIRGAGTGEDPVASVRASHFGQFQEFPVEREPGRDWVGFDYKFPSRVPASMRLKSVMLFESGCCGGLGLVFSGGERNLCLLQQPSVRPMALAGLNLSKEKICRYAADHGVVGRYTIHTWMADNLQYVLMSDLPHEDIEAAVDSLQYVH